MTNGRNIGPIHSNLSTLVAYMHPRIMWSIVNSLCVTRVAKRGLIHTQFQDMLLCVTRFTKRGLIHAQFKTRFSSTSVSYINVPKAYVFTTAGS